MPDLTRPATDREAELSRHLAEAERAAWRAHQYAARMRAVVEAARELVGGRAQAAAYRRGKPPDCVYCDAGSVGTLISGIDHGAGCPWHLLQLAVAAVADL